RDGKDHVGAYFLGTWFAVGCRWVRDGILPEGLKGGLPMKTETWNGHTIRFVWHDGEWWAVAKDVAKALGYSHTPSMVRMLDDEEKGVHNLHTPGGKQKMTIISETGIYEAILNSRRPEARE